MTIASHIGQYRIIRKIGAGGMGLVFLGEHTLLGRRAAIKTLLPTMSANREIVERFFNEARATSAISDPGVIQVFDFGYHVDGTAYIVMELLEGEALSARIERLGKLPPGDALRIARQIAGSLAAAHACDIVHRDLKPENIFLVADAEAQGGERTKILDFGICKMGTGDPTLTQSGAMIGTPVYMSPEQCRGAGGVDHRSDIYAFGCLVFHMLTGRPPFVGDASGELIVAHLEEDPPAPSLYVAELPFAVDALVLRCLAKAPESRYQSMTALQLELGDLAAGLGDPEPGVAPVPPSMPLGQGFRSLYDGNFAMGGSEPTATNRPPWLRFVPTPRTTPAPAESAVLPPRRATVRAVLAAVLVVGVVIGLVTTSFVVYSGDRDEADDRGRVTRSAAGDRASTGPERLEQAASTTLTAPAAAGLAAGAPRTAQAAHVSGTAEDTTAAINGTREDTAVNVNASGGVPGTAGDTSERALRSASSVAYSVEQPRRQRDAPREMKTVAKPRPRSTAELSSPSTAPRVVSLPEIAPAATAAPLPTATVAPTATPAPEDLYDTR